MFYIECFSLKNKKSLKYSIYKLDFKGLLD